MSAKTLNNTSLGIQNKDTNGPRKGKNIETCT